MAEQSSTDTAAMAAAGPAETKVQDVHLVVLCHGLWGSSPNLRYITRSIIEANPGAYLAPRSDVSWTALTDKETERIKKEEEKRRRAQAKGKKPAPDPNAWEHELLKPNYEHTGGHAPELQLVILNSRSNEERTYDGIDFSAERVRLEVDAEVKRLRTQTSPPCRIARFSVLGYSLGGLIARYLVGLLHSRHFFTLVPDAHIPAGIHDADTLQKLRQPPVPVQFITMATPHLGMLPPTSSFRTLAAFIGARTLSRTGEQLFLRDSGWEDIDGDNAEATDAEGQEGKKKRGLIEAMTVPDSLFMAALKRFQKVVIYANSVNDPTVPFRTAALYANDPFLVEGVQVKMEDDYEGLLHSITFPTGPVPRPSVIERIRNYQLPMFLNPKRNPFRFPLNYIAIPLFPLAFPLLLVLVVTHFNSESAHSRRRIRELRRLWREERALEEGHSSAQGAQASHSLSKGSVENRMSEPAGINGSKQPSGATTPLKSNGAAAAASTNASKSRLFGFGFGKSQPALTAAERRKLEEEEQGGERSRIRTLLRRVETQVIDAAEVGDGTLAGNLRRGESYRAGDGTSDAPAVTQSSSAASSSSSSSSSNGNSTSPAQRKSDRTSADPSTHAARFPPVPPELAQAQPKLFPLQHELIAHFERALGDKLERRFAHFARVLNSHAIIIVRVPGSELCKMGHGVVRHLADSFVV